VMKTALSTSEKVFGDPECLQHKNTGLMILNVAQLADVIAVDTETNAQDIRDGRGFARGVSIAFVVDGEGYTHYYPFRHAYGENYGERTLTMLKQVLESAPALVMHNAKYDIVALKTLGIDVYGKWFYDTMVIAQMVNENQPFSKGLDDVSKFYLGEDGKIKDPDVLKEIKTGTHNSTAAFIKEYAEKDTTGTWRLGEVLIPRLYDEVSEDLWENKQRLINTLITMESRGVRVHVDRANSLRAEGEDTLGRLKEDMGINPGSRPQLESALIDRLGLPVVKRTGAGAASFDKNAMIEYDRLLEAMDNPFAKQLEAYRGWQKAVSGYYKPYVEKLSPDGRLRCNYRLDTTVTGRFSCTEPNLQQIPKVTDKPWNGQVKSCFIPADGFTLWEVDYSQLELRLGTVYSQEPSLLEIFADPDRDVFTEMAAELGWPRQNVKTFVYSVQYGAGVNRVMNAFHVSEEVAVKMRKDFFRRYPKFQGIISRAAMKAEADGRTRLWSGRYRHYQNPKKESYKAFNSLIQGGSADIMERTMVRLFDEVDSDDTCRMLLQVHDAITFEIKAGLEDYYLPRIEEIMADVEGTIGESVNGVVFAVEAKSWGGEL
jgi:DNA polymerase I